VPFTTNGKRDYKKELAWEHKKKPTRVKDRAQRNGARAMVVAKKGKAAVAGKDVGHKTAISKGGANTLMNLFTQSPGTNSSFSRNKDGSLKSEKSKRESKAKKK
tara:strand:- start:340 stop:651 length:312 start_codon:yes stop_codon:yes gene_type:complete